MLVYLWTVFFLIDVVKSSLYVRLKDETLENCLWIAVSHKCPETESLVEKK
jgi:hypothetical protein